MPIAITDAAYNAALDADLDGTIDQAEWDAVYELLQPADLNDDGCTNIDDVLLFNAWFAASDQRADLVDDDVWNIDDVQAWLAIFAAACDDGCSP